MANVTAEAPRGVSSTRRTWVKVLILILVVTVPAFLLGHVIWHPFEMAPSPGMMPFFMVVSFFEALALGLGVSFLLFGLPLVRSVPSELKTRAWLMYPGYRLGLGLLVASRQPAHEQWRQHAEASVHRVWFPCHPGNQRCHSCLLLPVFTTRQKQ
jgi:hypothetical protein